MLLFDERAGMGGGNEGRAAPLRSGDPRRLGRYELVGRLGEGGMGTVYLARAAGGRLVAVKVIRPDLAREEEFRGRFRSEVNRARQVPPFCTAEVIDADPDHKRPYLVVEYVDGPSLAAVVTEQGPLTPSNLHSLAIGMATALTAIHGAGVIHRDLKPSNVLLAPGSPKVIDFGIARAVEATSQHTRTDQMLGTVAYMAPERFGPGGGALTPAADVFAWGAVLAYAGTGRTPFAADSPPVIAARILTQPPDLDGLVPPLRELVEHTLAKDPTRRPTSRELLDMLLGARPAAVAAVLAEQPALRVAAEEAQAATDQQPAAQLTAAAVPPELATVAAGRTESVAYTPPPPPAQPIRQVVAPPPPPRSGRSRWGRIANVALAFAVLLTSLTVAGMAAGVLPLGDDDKRVGGGSGATPSGGGPSPSPPASAPTGVVVVRDPLTAQRLWLTRDDPKERTTCVFEGALVVTRDKQGPYRCPGPMDPYTDFALSVDVRLIAEGSCAAMWFRFTGVAGYVVRICPEGFYLATHGVDDGITVRTLRSMLFDEPIPLDTPTRVTASMRGATIMLERDGERLGTIDDATFTAGRVVLGIYPDTPDHEPPFKVAFTNVEVRTFS